MPIRRDHSTLGAYEQEVDARSAASPRDGAVFFSGRTKNGEDNRLRAEDYVKSQPAGKSMLIDQTPCGKYLTEQELYGPQKNEQTRYPGEPSPLTPKDADKVWDRASQKYAKEASGHAVCFVDGASPDRTFRKSEFPALMANEGITGANGFSRSELQKDPKTAFERIEGKSRELPSVNRVSGRSEKAQKDRVGLNREMTGGQQKIPSARPVSREAAGRPPPTKGHDRGRGL